jgi:hypothetical protein
VAQPRRRLNPKFAVRSRPLSGRPAWRPCSQQTAGASRDGGWQCYRFEEDRTELHDLAERLPGDVTSLAARYTTWADACGVLPWAQVQTLR